MKKIAGSRRLETILTTSALLLLHGFVTYSQQPTHYPPAGGDPVSPTLVNILIFIGIPVLLYLLYRYFNKRRKR